MGTKKLTGMERAKDILLLCAGWLCCFGFLGICAWEIHSCAAENSRLYDIQQEAEHIRDTHTDKSIDPSKLAPYPSLPYVIADDDLCRITITGKPILSDDFVTGYERLRSYEGDVFQLTIENKSDKLTIRAGDGEDWVAKGRYTFNGEMVSKDGMLGTYNGFINTIGPGEEHKGEFSVFTDEDGNLDYVDALCGWFEICDDENQTVALYPFSWEDSENVIAHELPETFIDDDTCRFAVTGLEWDDRLGQWAWKYEVENKSDEVAHLVSDGSFNVAGSNGGEAFASFSGQEDGSSISLKPSGGVAKGRMTFHRIDGATGKTIPCATDEDDKPVNMYGTLSFVADEKGDDKDAILAYIPIDTVLRE